jgi:hypothetical protein
MRDSSAICDRVDVREADIDAPWLFRGQSFLRVNGVDVIPLVEAELNRRFPAAPAGTAGVSVGGEWSFAQTLRHLVMATDAWLGRAILGIEQPFHPIGQPNAEYETDGNDMSVFAAATPSYGDVLEVRAGRVAMVRDFLATVTSDDLDQARKNPWAPEYPETILSCLHVILAEKWEHHRYAVRDLDAIGATSGA